jgi:hypothetical protein
VSGAVRSLVEDRAGSAGLQHQRGNYCGEPVQLAEPELNQAVLTQPWPTSTDAERQPSVGPGPRPAPGSTLPIDEARSSGDEGTTVRSSTEERATPPCRGLGELRTQLAARLNDLEDPVVRSIRFSIYADYRGQDLSGLASAYRGAITGRGDLDVQLDLTLEGPMSKADAEQHCERLPNLPQATYSARAVVEFIPVDAGESAA